MHKTLLLYLAILLQMCFGKPEVSSRLIQLPAEFIDGLVYVQPVTTHGDTLKFLTDTGGSLLIYSNAVERLDLETYSAAMQGMPVRATRLPVLDDHNFIPTPLFTDGLLKIRPEAKIPPHLDMLEAHDGLLGQAWFAGRTWTFDYPAQKAWLRPPGSLPEHNQEDVIPLGIKTSAGGVPENYFVRIEVGIEGKLYSMLLQTGGSITLNRKAGDIHPNSGRVFSTGFISESIFKSWKAAHPGWHVVDEADHFYGSAMIEVPEVVIGSETVGPVWFTKRRDTAYMDWLSRFTDKKVVGALGGNALQDLRITLDYVNARAIVQKPES